MRTEALIEFLGRNVEAVDPRRLHRGLILAAVLGAAGALSIAVLTLGARPDLKKGWPFAFLLFKLAFTIGTVLVGYSLLTKFARPGGEWRASLSRASVPLLGIFLLAAISLGAAPRSHWESMVLGHTWFECLISIPLIAVLPFGLLVWCVRMVAAPTDLVRTGALVGMISGAISSVGYAVHCTDDSVPFVALWYGGTIALCTVVGAVLGPRLLRW
jgi:hypothetical protein